MEAFNNLMRRKSMQTKMCFHAGLNTIGGNITEIRYGNDRIIFDFGRAYDPTKEVDYLPEIEGVYDGESDYNTAVFISHLHLDHMAIIDKIHRSIPIYMSEQSKKLYEALLEVGENPKVPLEQIKTFDDGVTIGEIKVTAYPTDHGIVGSCALFVETPDRTVSYSGDIRMHGNEVHKNHEWIGAMRKANPDYLLMEGTSFFPPSERLSKERFTEDAALEMVSKSLDEATGVVFFNIYNRNVARLIRFIEICKNMGKTIVFEQPTATIVRKFTSENFEILTSELEEKIKNNPNNYFVQNSFENIKKLSDYNIQNAVYIHSDGTPLGEFDPSFEKMQIFLETLNIKYVSAACSGHADKDSILYIIDQIKPKTLVPWHSLCPQDVIPLDENQQVFLPVVGEWV